MKSFGAVLVLLYCGVVMTYDDITELHYGNKQSIKNEIEPEEDQATKTSSQQHCQPDIYTVLRELSITLGDQSVALGSTKSQISALEKQVEELKRQNEETEIRLKVSEKQVEELKSENRDQAQELRTLHMRYNITESHVRVLKTENDYKIAFSASLSTEDYTSVGPLQTPITLKYTNVLVNKGNAYNPHTGIFTAPVRGVYMFRFSVTGYGSTSIPVGVWLFKNGSYVVIGYCQQPSHTVSTTNGASLLLEVGDVVYIQLYPKAQIFDNVNRYNTFSGQLLFTV